MPSAYQQGPLPVPQVLPPPLAMLADSAQANGYQDWGASVLQPDASVPEVPAMTPTKGKNRANCLTEGRPKHHLCPICERGFATNGHLQRHQRIHTGIKAFKCPYPGCETRSSRQDNLQQHYRTHLSPTLRRRSGTGTHQAVIAALKAAGLKSSTLRQSRKSKGSQVGTLDLSSGASSMQGQSLYQTPTQAPAHYGGYMYSANEAHLYPRYVIPPDVGDMPQTQSSHIPSPVNGHSSASSMQSAQHQQQFYSQQSYSPAYAYRGLTFGQAYPSYGALNTIPSYGPPSHHSLYSPGVAPEHGQQHMYCPIQNFAPHSREVPHSVLARADWTNQTQSSNGGYLARTLSLIPLFRAHDELNARYRSTEAQGAPSAPRRCLTSPQAEMLPTGVVDPSSISNYNTPGQMVVPRASLSAVPPQHQYASAPNGGYASYGAAQGLTPVDRDGASIAFVRTCASTSSTSNLTEDCDTKGETRTNPIG